MGENKSTFFHVYAPVEFDIFSHFLSKEKKIPTHEQLELWSEPNRRYITLIPSKDGVVSELSLNNAIARFLLNRTPKSSIYRQRMGYSVPIRSKSRVEIFPQLLFKLFHEANNRYNAFVEEYYLAYLPGFDIHTVVMSQSHNEMYDYHDMLLGCIRNKDEVLYTAQKMIIENWKYRYVVGGRDACWKRLIKEGRLKFKEAMMCFYTVWGHSVEEVFDYEYGDKKKSLSYGLVKVREEAVASDELELLEVPHQEDE